MKDKKRAMMITLGLVIFIAALWYNGGNYTGTDAQVDSLIKENAAGINSTDVNAVQRRSLVNTSQGDLYLFVFGVVGLFTGFYLGYAWRGIILNRREGRGDGHGATPDGGGD
ncbi:MAG: hypothetical protein ACYC2T_12870 [Bacillota bacterium]